MFDGIYYEYIVNIYQNAHSNALNNSWNNGWSGGLLQLAVVSTLLLALLAVTRCSLRCCAERCSVVLLCDERNRRSTNSTRLQVVDEVKTLLLGRCCCD